MKKLIQLVHIVLLVFFLGFNGTEAQNYYQIQKKLVYKEGLAFLKNTDFGINSNSSQSITVNVYDKFILDQENTVKKDALMYGFKSTGNTGGNYENTNYTYDVGGESFWCYLGLCWFADGTKGGIPYKNSNSLKDFKNSLVKRQQYVTKQVPNNELGFYNIGDGTMDVVVEIELAEGTELSNILGVKLPGIANDLVGVNFTPTTFAFIGNYGCSGRQGAKDVSSLIKTIIKPDVIVSAGNDSYHNLSAGGCGTGYSSNTGILYNQWVATGQFKSVLGNMDYMDGAGRYLGRTGEQRWKTYFGNSTLNYSTVYGDKIEFFFINTNNTAGPNADPVNNTELQATKTWLTNALAASNKQYKIVVGHYAPYASGQGSSVLQSWNFEAMGADMYISSGPDFYERHDVNGIPYVNVGLGGFTKNATNYAGKYPATMVKNTHYAANFGALKATVGGNNIRLEFLTITGQKIDEFYIFGWESSNPANNYYLEKLRGTPISSNSESLDVYLILGQSNASGRCGWLCFREFTGNYGGELANSYLLNEKNVFEHAKNSFARYSTVEKYVYNSGLGVGWSFAKTLNTAFPNKKLGFISNARGGVETEQWFSNYVLKAGENYGETAVGYTPGNNLYQETKKRFMAMKAKYPNAKLKGVIWMQGESDAEKINTQNYNYAQRTKDLIQKFRIDTDYNSPNLRFLIPEMSYTSAAGSGTWNHTKLNQQIRSLHNPANNIYVTTVQGLTTTWDQTNVHWDLDSYNTLGIRLANVVVANPAARMSNSNVSNNVADVAIYDNLRIYPNPSKDGAFTVEFGLEQEGTTDLEIANLSGQLVYNKKYVNLEKGNHKLEFKKGDVNLFTGIYIIKLVTNDFTETRKLVVD